MKKRILVLLMALCIMTTFMPTFAFASDETTDASAKAQTESVQTDAVQNEKDPVQNAEEQKEKEDAEVKTETKEGEEAQPDDKKAEEAAEETPSVTEDAVPEETPEEAADFSFTADQADYLSYDPLYIAKYASDKYVNVESLDLSRFVNIVTAAKGIAAYTVDKDTSLDANTFIAGMTYEMPVYNIDDNSKYYVAIPNVNKFNGKNFPAFGLTVGYNNDEAETIKGWKYEKGILYIPKTAIDNPKNKHDVPDGAIIAVQLNYAIGKDVDFGKKIPVQILNGAEPKNKKVYAENIFDLDTLTIETGVKHRNASDITVFLNGQLIPVNDEAWDYSSSSGKLSIQAMPGVVSSVNVVFKSQTVAEKAKTIATSAVGLLADEAYAATLDSMNTLKNEAGQEVKLRFDVSQMFVGWRGHYTSKIVYKPHSSATAFDSYSGYKNSVSYLYGGYTSHSGSDFEDASANEKDQWLAPLWAIQSYAVAADTRMGSGDQGTLTWDEQVTHYYLNDTNKGTMTIYEWLNTYRNTLEKSKVVYGGAEGNSIGGSNNFAAHWPVNQTIAGSSTALAHPDGAPKANPSFVFETSEITANEWYAAGCSELGNAAESDADGDIYVTCLGLDTTSATPYIVLAFAQVRSGQNMTAIYKFGIDVGYVQLTKTQKQTETDFLTECPTNYSLAGAQYELYNAADGTRATDISGNPVTLTTGADGKTEIVAVPTGAYYAVETVASRGFKIDTAVQRTPVAVTVANTKNNPAQITSAEEPSEGVLINLRKVNKKGDYGWRRLIGAEYTLSYYDVEPSTTDVSGETAKRSWVFKTVEKVDPKTGESYAGIDFASDSPVSGDNFYTVKGTYGVDDGHAAYMHVDLDDSKDSIRIMPCGVYTIQETKAPTGMAKNKSIYYGKVYQPSNGAFAKTEANTGGDSTMTIEVGTENDVVNDEDLQSVAIDIAKYDKETDAQEAQGSDRDHVAGSLAGAEYEVYYDDNDLGAPELVGVITTDANGNGTLTKRELGDERFIGQDLKLGSYLIKEVQASPGYVLDKLYLNGEKTEDIPDGEIEVICDYESDGTPVTKTLKGTYEDGKHLFRARAEVIDANLFTYTIKSEETAHHTYVSKTDIATGEELPGATLQVLDSKGNIVEEWTSTNEPHDIVALHDETQGLKDGKYTLREITAPYGYDVAEDVEFEVKSDTILNKVEMKNKPITIGTTATDTETETHQGVFSEEAQIKDVVKITGLYEGRKYKVKGRLMDKATGEAMKDAQGADITAETDEFTATGDSMEVELTFSVDSSQYDIDTTTVAFEKLYRTTKVHDVEADVVPVELQKHEDIDDEDQTIHYGGIIGTTALDSHSGTHNVLGSIATKIIDRVKFENLSTKETYTLDGEFYDLTTGQMTGIKASKKFTPSEPDGTVDVEFSFDGTPYEGHTLVCYEKLSLNGTEINKHEDPKDPAQTMYVPKIRTVAGKPTKKGKVIDTIQYENLIPGMTYVARGNFVYQKDGKPVPKSDGYIRFTPATPNGTIDVTLSCAKGKGKMVAFERMYIINDKGEEKIVGHHVDTNDKAQTIEYKPVGKIVVSDKDKFKSSGVKTGDNTLIALWIALMTAAASGIIVFGVKRRRDKIKEENDILA